MSSKQRRCNTVQAREVCRSGATIQRGSRTYVEQCLEEVENIAGVELCISLQVWPSQTVQSPEIASFIEPSVYSKPFEIEMTLLSSGEASFEQKTMQGDDDINGEPYLWFSRLSSILIFNLALAHHGLAMSSRKGNDSGKRILFPNARYLYLLAYKSVQREHGQEIIHSLLLHLLIQAILNNLGRCFASLDDTEN
ncbi:hypothetical protein IV203_018870 [Nitzschia inconspicua]|uniref:Uncharacterized protein n=1 Tax=Nitzschia inconspicua TaxID=303405 RepID=A0A9K3M2P6_9STRA|nr:hypothetical protein IV203_018870 [Nitzschia inconspicua]